MSCLTLRVMCDWSAKPSWTAMLASGACVSRMRFKAWRARARARKVSGETPNTKPKSLDKVHGAMPFASPHRDSLRDGFRISAAANSSGQSEGCSVLLIAREKSNSRASRAASLGHARDGVGISQLSQLLACRNSR